MSKLRLIAMILGVILLAIPSVARAQATPTKIKLLTQNTGWALMHGRLYWTTDFGHDWRDITPPGVAPRGAETIADVFFLDVSDGWVLLRHRAPGGLYGDWSFGLASTDDGGITWSVSPIKILGWDIHRDNMLSGNGTVDFVDASNGWVELSLQSSAAFNLGTLFATKDGGRTWNRVEAPVGFGGVRFLSAQVGWAVGGPDDNTLVVTRDGGKTWTRTVIEAPPQLRPAPLAAYHLPIFTDQVHGVVEVAYPRGGSVALYATHDGGRSWNPTVAVPFRQMAGATATAVLESVLLTGEISRRATLVLTTFKAGAKSRRVAGSIRPNSGSASRLDFVGAQIGWVLAGGRLYSTLDGGTTWTDATPGPSKTTGSAATMGPERAGAQPTAPSTVTPDVAGPQATYAAASPNSGPGGGSSSLHTSVHLGFDSSILPTHADMQTWWKNSPYYGVGVYLGGKNERYPLSTEVPKQDSGTTAKTWVGDVISYGWGLIPFWAGLQSPCYTDTSKNYSTIPENDPTTAFNDGNDAASSAVKAASDAGLGTGSIIYYDMENYNQTDSTCQAAVVSFLDGWVYGLQNSKYVPGLYTNTGPAEADWPDLSGAIQDVLVAKDDTRATIWGLNCSKKDSTGCSPSYGLNDDTWAEGYRGHQYFSNSVDTPAVGGEEYGGTAAYFIDRDIEYACPPPGVRNCQLFLGG